MRFMKRLVSVILPSLLLCLALLPTALAAGPGSLCVNLDSDNGLTVSGIKVEIIQAASLHDGTLKLDSRFFGADVTAEQLGTNCDAQSAQNLYDHLITQGLSGTQRTTSDAGIAQFTNLQEGIYLVFERGGQKSTFLPYLVTLPTVQDGKTVYNVESKPKISEPGEKKLTVIKIWDDNNNAAGARPGAVQIELLRDGKLVRTVQLSDANAWRHTFEKLPDDGEYQVREGSVIGYKSSYRAIADGFEITNRYTGGSAPETTQVTVKKIWADHNDYYEKRPGSVTVQLVENGVVVKTAVLNEANDWSHVFTGLKPGESYFVREISVTGYHASYSGAAADGFFITNTYTPNDDPPKNPGDPSNPGDPTPPGDPSDPGDPTPPGDPSNPSDPTDPGDPSDPSDPIAPENPSESDDFTDPDVPSDSSDLMDPENPGAFIPQTGTTNVYQIYGMLLAGILLVILGVIEIRRGRGKA